MRKILFVLILGLIIVGTPLVTLAASGQKTYKGTGQLIASGVGTIHLEGSGNVDVKGNGTLTVSKNAQVKIKGIGTKTVQGDVVTYTGFNGSARIWGANIIIDVSGKIKNLTAKGSGEVRLEGDGSVKVKKVTANISNKAAQL